LLSGTTADAARRQTDIVVGVNADAVGVGVADLGTGIDRLLHLDVDEQVVLGGVGRHESCASAVVGVAHRSGFQQIRPRGIAVGVDPVVKRVEDVLTDLHLTVGRGGHQDERVGRRGIRAGRQCFLGQEARIVDAEMGPVGEADHVGGDHAARGQRLVDAKIEGAVFQHRHGRGGERRRGIEQIERTIAVDVDLDAVGRIVDDLAGQRRIHADVQAVDAGRVRRRPECHIAGDGGHRRVDTL
jgi:hypothetical protein